MAQNVHQDKDLRILSFVEVPPILYYEMEMHYYTHNAKDILNEVVLGLFQCKNWNEAFFIQTNVFILYYEIHYGAALDLQRLETHNAKNLVTGKYLLILLITELLLS